MNISDSDGLHARLKELTQDLDKRGFGGRVGYGKSPCIIVIDFVKGFTDPNSPLGADYGIQIEATGRILEIGREKNVPILFSTVAYQDVDGETGVWAKKIKPNRLLAAHSEYVRVDTRLGRKVGENIIVKRYASCFFGTDLLSQLIGKKIDTLLIAGCSTSGCVRATVVDACSYGYRSIVVKEAVGDRNEIGHNVALFDIDTKYGDVASLEEVVGYLRGK